MLSVPRFSTDSIRFWLCGVALAISTSSITEPVQALTYEERQLLDLSEYVVTDPDASYFDVEARLKTLQNTQNSMLLGHMDRLKAGPSCQQLLAIPPLTEEIRIPGFYPRPDAWRLASEPLQQFEDVVSNLAGAYISSNDPYYSKCLVRFLDHWAQADALMKFYHAAGDRQAWYATESMLSAAALGYSIVRPRVEGMDEEKARIDAWLNRAAHKHSSIPGDAGNSCCNNHFYRRALYASMIGILTNDNALFRFGVSAVYSALHELTPEGGLPLEIARGRRASHYQNYALLYLVTNMQVISRQGYDIFSLEINNNTIHQAADYALAIINDPSQLKDYAPHEQYRGFLDDEQYFSWMEIYLAHFDNPAMERFIEKYRPIDNRGAGGYVTLYFMNPADQQQVVLRKSAKEKAEVLVPEDQ